jgi:hypothetical protein
VALGQALVQKVVRLEPRGEARLDEARADGVHTCKKAVCFLRFPYVCPEPVLAKYSFLYVNGFKRPFSRTDVLGRELDAHVLRKLQHSAFACRNVSFPSTPPMFVPSLSWQMFAFEASNGIATKGF